MAFHDWVLLNKYFIEGFVKHHRQAVREKQFYEGQSLIKKKVNNFISALKDKAVELEQQQLQQQYNTGVFPNIEQEQPAIETNNKALRNITNNGESKQEIEKKAAQKNLAQQSYISKKESQRGLNKINDSFGVESKSTVQTDETCGGPNTKAVNSQFESDQEEYEEEKLLKQPEKLRDDSQVSSPIRSNPSQLKNSAICKVLSIWLLVNFSL